MFDEIQIPKFPVTISVGEEYSVNIYDEIEYRELNILAGHLYSVLGYVDRDGFDYYTSNHPMERNMFSMALISKWFSDEIGF